MSGLRKKASTPSRREMLRVVGLIVSRLRKNPELPARHLVAFAKQLPAILRERSDLSAPPSDKRFSDEGWQQKRVSKIAMQIYLAACSEAYALVNELEFSGRDASSVRFVSTMLIEALAPSNNPFVNPAVVKAAQKSRGKTLLRGLYQLIGDQLDNGGLISMVDRDAFEIGRNIATTPGEVVYRNELLELIQYRPSTSEVYERPLMIVPPQINKFYVLDLSPENSLARYLVNNGIQTFMVSWRNPKAEHRGWGLEQYCDALEQAHKAVMEIAGSPDINWKGLCAGGLTSSLTLARYAARNQDGTVRSLTLNVTLLDTVGIEQTNLGYFVNEDMLEKGRIQSQTDGVLDGAKMAKMFAWLRPNDLVWNYWVNNYLMGQKPSAYDVLFWNADTTRLPAALHSDFIDLAIANPFGSGLPWKVGSEKIQLAGVELDKFVVAGRTDHITSWSGCYRSVHILGGKSEFVLSNSGHVQTLISPPGGRKASFRTASVTPEDPEAWLKASESHVGSWWEHWNVWLQARSGAKKRAPSRAGSDRYQPLGPAPGSYVRE